MRLYWFCALCFVLGILFQVLVLKFIEPAIKERRFSIARIFIGTALIALMLGIGYWLRTLIATM
jgi:tellurite resistance protein TehA-like permease